MDRILVTGSGGLVGKAIQSISNSFNYEFFWCTRYDADLTREEDVRSLYRQVKPDYVIHTAAKVGGIGANLASPADFYYQNILMNSFMIHYAQIFGVKKLIAFSSVCSFPDNIPILKEEFQHTGEPFRANFAYGYAKRMVDIQIQAYRIQHKTNYCSLVPVNIYGPDDQFNLQNGHVVPCIIHKCFLAKQNNEPLVLWGDGSSLREFIFSQDLAKLTMDILQTELKFDRIIVADNIEVSIKDLVNMICELMDFKGEVVWDTTKPNGQYRRPSDTSLLKDVSPNFQFTPLKDGLKQTIEWFEKNYPNVRH